MEEGELVQTIKDFIISRGGCDFGGSEFTQLYEEKEGARDAMKRVSRYGIVLRYYTTKHSVLTWQILLYQVRKRGGLAALCARYPTEVVNFRYLPMLLLQSARY